MNMHVTADWATPKTYLRRGHIAALVAALALRVQIALIRHRERRDIRRLRAASDHLPDYLRRDIGLL